MPKLWVKISEDLSELTAEQVARKLMLLPQWRRVEADRYKYALGKALSAEAVLLLMEGLREAFDYQGAVEFEVGEHGKPTLRGVEDIHFNLSHSRRRAMCVVAPYPVGCDIEQVPEKVHEAVAEKYFSKQEQEAVRNSTQPATEFARIWTQKEAVSKLRGIGITDDFHSVLCGCEKVVDPSGKVTLRCEEFEVVTTTADGGEYVASVARYLSADKI